MKRIICIFATATLCCGVSGAVEITEDNYVRLDNELWDSFEAEGERLENEYRENPDKRDSLVGVAKELEAAADRENVKLALQFASTPSGLRRVYMLRLDIPKDVTDSVLRAVPAELRESAYGCSIKMHLDNDQVVVGGMYYDFTAKDSDGNDFRLSSLAGKRILLLYGGLGCMGDHGRKELARLYRDTSRDDFEIVVYENAKGPAALKKLKDMYSAEYVLVSDFLADHTPVKIMYGAQAMPTCFLIDSDGTVLMKTVGFFEQRVRKLLDR